MKPLVDIIIVSFNGKSRLEYSLPTLCGQKYPRFRIFIALNNSTDGTEEWVKNTFPQVYLIRQPVNLGMAAMNDILLAPQKLGLPPAEFIFVAGWDLRFDPRCIDHAISTYLENPDIGVLGFEVLGLFEWVEPSALESASSSFSTVSIKDVAWVPGACSIYPCRLLHTVGFLDPVYFAYCEEDDLQIRVAASGFRRVLINTPVWQHADGGSIPSLIASYLAMRNGIRLALKYRGLFAALRTAGSMLNVACNPWISFNAKSRFEKRKRPSNIFTNFTIWLRAFAWNFINLRKTIIAGRLAVQQIAAGKILFKELNHENR